MPIDYYLALESLPVGYWGAPQFLNTNITPFIIASERYQYRYSLQGLIHLE